MRRPDSVVSKWSLFNTRNPITVRGVYLLVVLAVGLFAQTSWSAPLQLIKPAEVAARYHNETGLLFISKGAPDRALAEFNKALELHADFLWPLFNRGLVYLRMGQYENAISDFDKVIVSGNPDAKVARKGTDLSPEQFAAVYFQRGKARLDKADYDLAIADFSRALEWNPSFRQAYNNRGAAYLEKWQFEEAKADLERALGLDPKYALAYMNLGVLDYRQNQNESAIRNYDQAIRLDPKLAVAYANRGRAHLKSHRFEQALADFTKALEINPDTATAHDGLAVLYTLQSQYGEAEAHFRNALTLFEKCSGANHPHVLEVLEHYATILRKASRYSDATALEARLNPLAMAGEQ